jgi:hypothetical protein
MQQHEAAHGLQQQPGRIHDDPSEWGDGGMALLGNNRHRWILAAAYKLPALPSQPSSMTQP